MIDAVGFDRFGSNSTSRYEYVYSFLTFSNDSKKYLHRANCSSLEYSFPSRTPEKPKSFPEQFDANFDFSDDILCLMPPTHLGYSFSAKFWGQLCVEDLSEIVFNEHAFDRLVLSEDYKDIIKAQVETFSLKSDQLVSDFVDNKGGGMIMVLHGNPGK